MLLLIVKRKQRELLIFEVSFFIDNYEEKEITYLQWRALIKASPLQNLEKKINEKYNQSGKQIYL